MDPERFGISFPNPTVCPFRIDVPLERCQEHYICMRYQNLHPPQYAIGYPNPRFHPPTFEIFLQFLRVYLEGKTSE